MNPDTIDTIRTTGIGTVGVTWSFMGMPFSEIAALATAVYVFIKILLLLPELKNKYWKRK
jgi:hypothetical protein